MRSLVTRFFSQSVSLRPRTSRLLVFLLGLSFVATGQEKLQQPDTTLKSFPFLSLELSFGKPDFLFSSPLDLTPETFPAYFRQSLANPLPTLPWQLQENIDLQSIWQQELARQNKYRTLRTILGSVQMGTVAYLTYLHLKKYGFRYK